MAGDPQRKSGGDAVLADLLADMEAWPEAWEGLESDLPVGERLVKAMHPFVESLVAKGLSRSTIRRHLNELWLLGGEIISRGHHDSSLQRMTGTRLLQEFVSEDGGPMSRHLHFEAEQRTFDATCRMLHRFLAPETSRQKESRDGSSIVQPVVRPGTTYPTRPPVAGGAASLSPLAHG